MRIFFWENVIIVHTNLKRIRTIFFVNKHQYNRYLVKLSKQVSWFHVLSGHLFCKTVPLNMILWNFTAVFRTLLFLLFHSCRCRAKRSFWSRSTSRFFAAYFNEFNMCLCIHSEEPKMSGERIFLRGFLFELEMRGAIAH